MTRRVIIVRDIREAKPGLVHTGGCYSYSQIYREVSPGLWEVEYHTSSEIAYCPVRGGFLECSQCMDWEHKRCTASPVIITEEELREIISSAEKTEGMSWEEVF